MIKLYEVGGSIRNEFLGVPCKDVDYAVEANSYENMIDYIRQIGGVVLFERPEFGSCKVRMNADVFDFTLCRTDGKYEDRRHPSSIQRATIETDLQRRDFTMNAIAREVDCYLCPREDTKLIDPFHGQLDIQTKTIRCVGNTKDRLTEDPLRLLRAMRFHILYDLSIDENITEYFDNQGFLETLFKSISRERIYSELSKCMAHNPMKTFQFFLSFPRFASFVFRIMYVKMVPIT